MSERISDNPIVREKLYEQFNARICFPDLYQIFKQMTRLCYKNNKVELLFPVEINTEETIAFLENHFYGDLIFDLISHVRINEDLGDSLSVKFDKNIIDFFNRLLSHPFEKKDSVGYCKEGLIITTSDFIADVVIHPMSQFHSEVIKVANNFLPIVRMNKEMGAKFFLEAYSPSMFTQYAQYWVAERLGLIKETSKIMVV